MSAILKTRRPPAPPPSARFAVVTNPGTLFQAVDVYAQTLPAAHEWAAGLREDGVEVTVMHVTANGSLTAEI